MDEAETLLTSDTLPRHKKEQRRIKNFLTRFRRCSKNDAPSWVSERETRGGFSLSGFRHNSQLSAVLNLIKDLIGRVSVQNTRLVTRE